MVWIKTTKAIDIAALDRELGAPGIVVRARGGEADDHGNTKTVIAEGVSEAKLRAAIRAHTPRRRAGALDVNKLADALADPTLDADGLRRAILAAIGLDVA